MLFDVLQGKSIKNNKKYQHLHYFMYVYVQKNEKNFGLETFHYVIDEKYKMCVTAIYPNNKLDIELSYKIIYLRFVLKLIIPYKFFVSRGFKRKNA
jgi:hypothetical protein